LTGWAIAIVLVILILRLKVGVRFRWDSGDSLLKVRVGMLRFSLPAGKDKSDRKTKVSHKTPPSEPTIPTQKKKKGLSPSLKSWLKALLACWRELLALIGKVLKSPTLDLLRLHMMVGGGDPEVCAMNYGKICAGLSAGLPVLQRVFRVRKQDIDITCRYDLKKTETLAEVEATVMIYEIFALIGAVLVLLVKIYITKKQNDKAVQTV